MKILDGMRRIESKEDLMKWANAVNSGQMTAQNKCDFQDVYARSERNLLDRLFIESNGSRNMIVCSVNNTMSYDEVEHLLKTWAAFQANKIINAEIERYLTEENKRSVEIGKRESIFADCKRAMFRRFRDMKKQNEILLRQNEELKRRIESYREETLAANRHANEYERKAAKYDAIKAALS